MGSRIPPLNISRIESILYAVAEVAEDHGHAYATVEHLLLALLRDPEASAILRECGGNLKQIEADLTAYLAAGNIPLGEDVVESAAFLRVERRAFTRCVVAGERTVDPHHLLAAVAEFPSAARYILERAGINPRAVLTQSNQRRSRLWGDGRKARKPAVPEPVGTLF